jgi:hypothetical protein
MSKSRARTSLKITFLPEGGAYVEMKYSDADSRRPSEDVAREIIGELTKVPSYKWLLEFGKVDKVKPNLTVEQIAKALKKAQ